MNESITFESLRMYEKRELFYKDHISTSNFGYSNLRSYLFYYSDDTNFECSNIQVQNHKCIIGSI